MKKILGLLALVALVSMPAFSAACVNGLTFASQVSCDITNGSNTWTLSNFTNLPMNATNYGSQPTTSSMTVNYGTYTVGSQQGFYVDFSPGSGANFFSATAGQSGAQVANMYPIYTINGTPLVSMGVAILGASGTGGYVAVTKCNYTSGSFCTETISANTVPDGYGPNSTSLPNLGTFQVQDSYQINSGNSASISITSFRNYFLPTATNGEIPEPMTFALMGAGLVGLAVLRRRAS